jgi:hypothetical protein
MLRHGRSAALAATVFVLAVPAVAAAAKDAKSAMDARVVLHTAGAAAGQVSVVAHVDHPADPGHGYEDVHVVLSRHGEVLGDDTERFPLSHHHAIRAPHRILLSAAESKRARTVARDGRLRLRVTVTHKRANPGPAAARQAAAAAVMTQTVSMLPSSEPPLASTYTASDGSAIVYLSDVGGRYFVDTLESRTPGVTSSWRSPQGPRPLTCAGIQCTWSGAGQWRSSDGTFADGTADGFFLVDAPRGFAEWPATGSVPAFSGSVLPG